jgi:VanZ family protein
MGFIFYLSSQPTISLLGEGWYSPLRDVVGHFTVYAVLAILWERALAGLGAPRAERWAFIIALGYAFSDEFHQSFVPGRSADLFDVTTDALGAAFGLWVASRWRLRQSGPATAQTGSFRT